MSNETRVRSALIFNTSSETCARLREILEEHFVVHEVQSSNAMLCRLAQHPPPDLVFAQLLLPQRKGLALVRQIRELAPASETLVLSPIESPACAVAAIKAGAFGFLSKRDDEEAILTVAYEAIEQIELHRCEQVRRSADLLPTTNRQMCEVIASLPAIGKSVKHVVVAGEIGTGRVAIARALHNYSPWPGVLRLVDCADAGREPLDALLQLVEEEPTKPREPLNNTICLLNLDRLPASELSSLIKLCAGPVSVRMSDGSSLLVRYRIIATCAEDAEQLRGAPFDAVFIEVPPLRHRLDDLPLLCAELAQRWAHKYRACPKQLTPSALEVLATYAWPANLLELSNIIERLTLSCAGDTIDASAVPLEIHINAWRRGVTYRDAMERLEREFLLRTLSRAGGCRRRAAERLQLPYSTLKFRLRKLAITKTEG